jgi:hypothetical protein
MSRPELSFRWRKRNEYLSGNRDYSRGKLSAISSYQPRVDHAAMEAET